MYNEQTQDWKDYQDGLSYQAKLNLLAITNKNYDFYANRHWRYLNTKGLKKTVIPVSQQIADLKGAVVGSDNISMNFTVQGVPTDTKDEAQIMQKQLAEYLNGHSKTTWEILKMDDMNRKGILDAEITGDYISFWLWDEMINAGKSESGEVNWGEMVGERIDNVNYFPGDPTLDEINNSYRPIQPYIILAFRRQIEDVKAEAKRNKVSADDIEKIVGDSDTQNQLGGSSKNGLDQSKKQCTVIMKLWYKYEEVKEISKLTGKEIIKDRIWHIMARKSTKDVVIREEWDTGFHRYPVAVMHWKDKKGSAYGESEIESIIPNQIQINSLATYIATWISYHGMPPVLFDSQRIKAWTNNLSAAIPVNGTDTGGISSAATYMVPAQISGVVLQFLEFMIETTKKAFGANEAILGEAAGNNYSANALNTQNALTPLNPHKERFYNYIEDVGLIWLDMWLSKYKEYPNRQLEVMNGKTKQVVPFDANKLDGVRLRLKIDVGPSTKWSEAAMVQAVKDMMDKQWITVLEGFERLPDTVLPNKQGLIDARSGQSDADKKYLYDVTTLLVKMFTPEAQNQLQGMTVDEVKQQVEKMVASKQPLPIQQQAPQEAPPQQKPPSVSISFKDVPPLGQAQILAQANVQMTPQELEQHQINQMAQKQPQNINNGGMTNG